MAAAAAREALALELEKSGTTRRPIEDIADFIAGVAAAPATPAGFPGLDLIADAASADARRFAEAAAKTAQRFRDELGRSGESANRLKALRNELAGRGLTGLLVPRTDEYHGEYVPMRAERLRWLTSFSGSAGLAVVLSERAAVFTDGRYTLQLREQIETALFEPRHIIEEPPSEWLAGALKPGDRLGYDPWLHTIAEVARYRKDCAQAGADLVALESNPVDAIWSDQPPAPLSPVMALPLAYAGEAAAAKRGRIAAEIVKRGNDAVVLTLPESIAWLLNIRGGDVPHTPLALGFAILSGSGATDLFIDRRKLGPALAAHLGPGVTIRPLADFGPALDALGCAGKRVQADPATAAAWVFDRLEAAGATLRRAADPCLLPKACKNPIELDGSRKAHLRDGAAMVRFLAWLEGAVAAGIDEIGAAAKLGGFRAENEHFQDLSFPTISGAGPNGAIVHYQATDRTNLRLEPGMLYLVDSGAQYLDGTTDITRTVALGEPNREMRDRFTRVLKGHIALAICRFPVGTTGQQLDTLARHALWQAGLDYDHGTGHGVGSFLSVHEGPQRIAKAGAPVPLRPGMIVSNEPGYYKTGAYGIRIENLVTVVEVAAPPGAERKLLGFETLTRVPIDAKLIEPDMMTAAEIAWLDAYHAQVRADLAPFLDAATAAWLDAATAPFPRSA